MAYLIDTGILLRLVDVNDRDHLSVRTAVRFLGDQQEGLFIATQNMAEFCNVTTRPIANNGLGLSPARAIEIFEADIEPICAILSEVEAVYVELKRLIAKYAVTGKQVHDARLVAMMLVWQIENVLTHNDRDFRRYEQEGIHIITPSTLINPAGCFSVNCLPPRATAGLPSSALPGLHLAAHPSVVFRYFEWHHYREDRRQNHIHQSLI